MRTLKSKGGFTLVELIVVIAILAILAGVAIPVYNSYINRAQDAAAITELDAIATAAQAANATAGAISNIVITNNANADDSIVITADVLSEKYADDFKLFYPEANTATLDGTTKCTVTVDLSNTLDGTSYVKGATWSGAKWEATK